MRATVLKPNGGFGVRRLGAASVFFKELPGPPLTERTNSAAVFHPQHRKPMRVFQVF